MLFSELPIEIYEFCKLKRDADVIADVSTPRSQRQHARAAVSSEPTLHRHVARGGLPVRERTHRSARRSQPLAGRAQQPGRECAGALSARGRGSVPLHFAGRRARLAGTARAGTRGGGRDARGSPARGTWRPANGSARGGGRPRSAWRGLPPVSVGSAGRDSGSSSRNACSIDFLRFCSGSPP